MNLQMMSSLQKAKHDLEQFVHQVQDHVMIMNKGIEAASQTDKVIAQLIHTNSHKKI